MILLLEIIFWMAITWLTYVFVLYPVGMLVLSGLRPRPLSRRSGYFPRVCFVMAAYNEERVIAARLNNYHELDYPRELLRFRIGSDASNDTTDTIIEQYAADDQSIELHRFNRCGKTRIVYELAESLTEEIIVFTDADVLLEPDAILKIVDCFSDPEVGGVIGRMMYTDIEGNAGNSGQRKYLEIENQLRHAEGLVWTTVGPRGECFAVRNGSFIPLADYRLSDDLNLVITIAIGGHRVWYEPSVLIRETSRRSLGTEFRRRLRMGQQAAATLLSYPATRFPWRSWIGFQIWSHKLLRITAALPIALVAITSIALVTHSSLYLLVALCVAAWVGVMLLGALAERLRLELRLLQYPLYFTMMLFSLTVGSIRGVMRGGLEQWSSQRLD